jgi:hypothetical protein
MFDIFEKELLGLLMLNHSGKILIMRFLDDLLVLYKFIKVNKLLDNNIPVSSSSIPVKY